jgi:hypothetical protein
MTGLLIRIREEKGISAVIVAISLVGLFGAAVLAIDAGSAWATRRKIVTGTDAAALEAAWRFSQGGPYDPCTTDGRTLAENQATAVLHVNSPDAEHIAAPTGFEVVVSGCPSAPVGHVRYDARLGSKQGFSGIFGFGQTRPYSSSTAEFGYITSPVGLRPIAICDQSTVTWPVGQPVIPPALTPGPVSASGVYPHFALWNWLQKGTYANFDQAAYNRYFGSLVTEYPSVSLGNTDAINNGLTYLSPALGGGVVHRIDARDACGGGASWSGWVDLNGGSNGSGTGKECPPKNGLQTLECMLEIGFNGLPAPVSVGDPGPPASPPQCNNGSDQWCSVNDGNHNGIKSSLNALTCPAATQSADCVRDGKFIVVILDNGVFLVSGSDDVHQVAFVYVILRGWGSLDADNNPCSGGSHSCTFDFEFLKVQGTGTIGHNPSPTDTTPKATDLCGIDHDSQANRCNV